MTIKDKLISLKKETGCNLSLDELEYLNKHLGHLPSCLEVFVFDTVWSEHCSYKSSKPYLKTFFQLSNPDVWVGIGEDAGIIRLAEVDGKEWGLVVAHESHNHPSQVVPFEGAATGIGGIVRDVYCMGAEVIGVMDSLRFGEIDEHSLQIIRGVIDGVGGYSNPLGIPNIGGDTYLHRGFRDNCLVNVIAIGIVERDRIIHSFVPKEVENEPYVLILVGKATDSSGFGGASFASADLDKHETRKSAVQNPDPFLKRVLVAANRECFEFVHKNKLKVAMKDLGAGGILGAASEITGKSMHGAEINIEDILVGEDGLSPQVILCSETQERYIWAVPEKAAKGLLKIYNEEYELGSIYKNAGASIIGYVRKDNKYIIKHNGVELLNLSSKSLNEGIIHYRPVNERKKIEYNLKRKPFSILKVLDTLLYSPNIQSKRPLFETYDCEVQGRAVLRPGEGDACIIRPFRGSNIGIASSVDGNPLYGSNDPYLAGALAVLEVVHNIVTTGAKPICVTDCLNFGNPEKAEVLHDFKESIRGIKEACDNIGYMLQEHVPLPIISGNVSFYNQSKQGQAIPPSPIVAGFGIIDDISKSPGMGFKSPQNAIVLIGERFEELGCSLFREVYYDSSWGSYPFLDGGMRG